MCIRDSRMRVFYAAYEESPEIIRLAMSLGWTRNVAILEGCGSNEDRSWYIRAVLCFGWKKGKLLEAIESQAWLHSSLDEMCIRDSICPIRIRQNIRECPSMTVRRSSLPLPL